jgi:hypothetical protein
MVQAFENLNVNALYEVLAEILGEKHEAKISYKVMPKAEEDIEDGC